MSLRPFKLPTPPTSKKLNPEWVRASDAGLGFGIKGRGLEDESRTEDTRMSR